MILSGEYSRKIKREKLESLLDSHLKIEKDLLDLIYSDSIDYNILKEKVQDLLDVRNNTHFILNYEFDKYKELKLNVLKEKELSPFVSQAFNDLNSEISRIVTILNKDERPFINLKHILTFINNFNKYILKNNTEIILNTNIDSLLISNNNHNIPIKLNDKNILLTPRNFDLSQLSQDQLIEILRVLDVISKDDTYDYLRTKIVEQISNLTSITFVNEYEN